MLLQTASFFPRGSAPGIKRWPSPRSLCYIQSLSFPPLTPFYPHFQHRLSCLVRLALADVNLLVKGKGEKAGEGTGFYSCAASQRGGQPFTDGPAAGLKTVSEVCKDTHTHTHTRTHRMEDAVVEAVVKWQQRTLEQLRSDTSSPVADALALVCHSAMCHTNNEASSLCHSYKSNQQTTCAHHQVRWIQIEAGIWSY